MKNAEFIALMISNTNKTRNLRTYGKRWFSGAHRICDKIASKIGKMIALIQDRIDHGEIIDGNEQSLLVYNFQPLLCVTNALYLTFDMLIKPLGEIHDTHNLSGTPIQLVVDAVTGDVMNNDRAMLQMGLSDIEVEDTQNPIYYGNYTEYNAICSFMTIRHHEAVRHDDIFTGKLDRSPLIQSSLAFDSFVEARDYLENNWAEYCMVAELNYPKEEHHKILAQGKVGHHMIKLIHPHNPEVQVSTKITTEPREDRIDDEVNRLLDATREPPTVSEFCIAT